jgi:hypothetical protein
LYRQKLPGWQTWGFADAPGISKITMLVDTEIVEPNRIGAAFPNLEAAAFLKSRESLAGLDFGQLTPGWHEFGMMSFRGGSEVTAGRYGAGAMAWALFFEWNPLRNNDAWEALLEAQETIRPKRTSLMPDFIIPLMFLTRMAAFPVILGERGQAAQWTYCFARSQKRLSPLVIGLFVEWMRGSSQAAARYRGLTGGGHPTLLDEQKKALKRWQMIFGTDLIEAVRKAERVEPTIFRGLDAGSARLWSDSALEVPEQLVDFAAGLLPVARWQPSPPGPGTLAEGDLESLATLSQAWKNWRSAAKP